MTVNGFLDKFSGHGYSDSVTIRNMEQVLEFCRQEATKGDESPQASKAASARTLEAPTRLESSPGQRSRRAPGISDMYSRDPRRSSLFTLRPVIPTGSVADRYNHV